MLLGYKAGNHPQQIAKRGICDDTDTRGTAFEIFNPLTEADRALQDVTHWAPLPIFARQLGAKP